MVDAAEITALRSQQLYGLYDYASTLWAQGKDQWRQSRLQEANQALVSIFTLDFIVSCSNPGPIINTFVMISDILL
jgi:hypothetical protein